MKVKVGISNRHIHLTEDAYRLLFEKNLTKKMDLTQPGEFAANETVTISYNNKFIEHVRIVGPFRSYNQVELSASDAKKLGINPPITSSGDLKNALDLIITSEKGSYNLKKCCIIQERHIHMNPQMANFLHVTNHQQVKLKIDGKKVGEMVAFVKIGDNSPIEAHIDVDDASAFGLQNGDEVELVV